MLTSGCFLPRINTQGLCLLGASQQWIRCCLSLGPNDLKTRFNKFCQIISQPKPNNHWNKSQTQLPLAKKNEKSTPFSLWIPPRRKRHWLERFFLLPSIEAVITPKNMLPWSSKRMARAELLCTYKRMCSFFWKKCFPAAGWSESYYHILYHAYLLSTWLNLTWKVSF